MSGRMEWGRIKSLVRDRFVRDVVCTVKAMS